MLLGIDYIGVVFDKLVSETRVRESSSASIGFFDTAITVRRYQQNAGHFAEVTLR